MEKRWGDAREGIEILKSGGLVVYPTDTLYGLGCSCAECMKRLFKIKGREKNFSLIFPDAASAIDFLVSEGGDPNPEVICEFLPGPFTFIISGWGIRVPQCEIALTLARGAGPITATSANFQGKKGPTTAQESFSELGGLVDLYIDGGTTRYGGPSTVVELQEGKVSILRNGVGDTWKSRNGRTIGELAR